MGRSWGSYGGGFDGYGFAPYVSVARRRANALKYGHTLAKERGCKLAPVKIAGRQMATTFWGQAWCDNLEAYSDFANRLPRGKTYARNGSVFDLQIAKGKIEALVSGSEIYEISIEIAPLPPKTWKSLQRECAKSIASLLDLLQGRFEQGVMERLTRKEDGLFPKPKEIKMSCSCPDYAGLCKHLAAVLYGVGARLDQSPEMLFSLRHVDHLELIGQAASAENLNRALQGESNDALNAGDLGAMFGIELESATGTAKKARTALSKSAKSTAPAKPKPEAKRRVAKPVANSKSKSKPARVDAAGETPAAKAQKRTANRKKLAAAQSASGELGKATAKASTNRAKSKPKKTTAAL